jgi:hypothetical protein
MRLFVVVAGLVLLSVPGQASAACRVSLKVKGGADGAGLTAGMSANLVAVARGCGDVELEVIRVRVDNLGRRVGKASRHACANPCRIRDRRTSEGGYDYQVRVRGKRARSQVVRVYWASSGSGGSGGGGTGGGGGGGTGGGGGSGTATVTCTLTGSDVVNNQGSALSVDASGMNADYRSPSGAFYHYRYEWTVPSTLVAGQPATLTLKGTTSEVSPDQDILDGYGMRALGFKEVVANQYRKGDGSHTESGSWSYTPSAGTAAGTTMDIIVDIVSSEVRYHYQCA